MAALLNGKGWSYILGHFEEYTHAKGLSKTTSHEIMFCVQEFINFLEINHIQYPNNLKIL